MHSKHLATYLNDHLAGSVTAIEMLGLIATAYHDTDAGVVAAELREEVLADRSVLEELMRKFDISQSTLRKSSAWLAEKAVQIKLRWDDPAGGQLRLLEAVEAVSLGIEGKRLLLALLATVSNTTSELQGIDYPHLIQRAEDQRTRAEVVRLKAGQIALFDQPAQV